MTTLERAKDIASLSRIAACVTTCFKEGAVHDSVAEGLKSVFPGANLLSVSVPTSGLAELLVISAANLLEEGFTSIGLCALKTSAAGRSFSGNAVFASAEAQSHPDVQETPRYHDAEYAKGKWGAEELLCCPIPLSLPAAVARQSSPEAPDPMRDVLGVVTLGLSAGTAATGRLKEKLRELATHLAETIERDSRAVVEQVCQYHLGVARTELPEAPTKELSASCSEEGRNDSGSGTDPPSGALPQLVTPEGGAERSNFPGPDSGGRAQQGDSPGKPGPSEGKPSGKAAPADSDEASASVADLAVPARPAAPVPSLGTSVPGDWTDAPGKWPHTQNEEESLCKSSAAGIGGAVKWDQRLRARMVNTFDASAAGCSASAFEAAAYEYDPHEKGAAKKGAGGVRVRNFVRTPAMTFVDEGLEAEYTLWQARQRWQLDVAGFLFLLAIAGTSIVMGPAHSATALQHSWLACLMHALPLAAMAINLRWYLRKREQVLGVYMVCLAFHAVYLSNRAALRLEPQSALSALVWFSRVQAAEPLLFHAIMFAVRFRTALLVQAVCVVIAASNAGAVCSSCCSTFMAPTFCLLKALATQAVFGYGVPAAVLYFTEENFRQIFAEACVIES
ncbi:hypothetical protein COCOBI_07-5150 [Coccomyxa sp. Obi]|nr:hypothetical protein COCOBI_07-5150 [Coccomyxa sp. Obi]